MHRDLAAISIFAALLAGGCAGSTGVGSGSGGSARVELGEATYEVREVSMTIKTGEGAWFTIDGEPLERGQEECAPGLSEGLGLYGDLPSSVRASKDLAGLSLRVDFSGDGDDGNFCFAGMGGLAGAEDAWVTIQSVSGDIVTFSMTGKFKIYDANGEGPIRSATASGTAIVRKES